MARKTGEFICDVGFDFGKVTNGNYHVLQFRPGDVVDLNEKDRKLAIKHGAKMHFVEAPGEDEPDEDEKAKAEAEAAAKKQAEEDAAKKAAEEAAAKKAAEEKAKKDAENKGGNKPK